MELLSPVALLENVPAEGLVRGQVGTIVEVYDADHFEVEFVDPQGVTYGLTALESSQIMPWSTPPQGPPNASGRFARCVPKSRKRQNRRETRASRPSMNGMNLSKIAAAVALGATTLGIAPSAQAQSINDLINRRQGKKNEWRNLAILGGAAGLVGLFTKNRTVAALGLGGGLYSLYRYEQDRKSQSKLAQQRADLFGRKSFTYNGKRYVRKTRTKNGQRYYQFVRG